MLHVQKHVGWRDSSVEAIKREWNWSLQEKKQDMESLWLLWILDLFAYNRMVLLIYSILWLALFSCHVTLFKIYILHFLVLKWYIQISFQKTCISLSNILGSTMSETLNISKNFPRQLVPVIRNKNIKQWRWNNWERCLRMITFKWDDTTLVGVLLMRII